MMTIKQYDTKLYIARTDTLLNSQASALWNLEVKIGQIANANATRPQGLLPSDSIPNPKE